MIAIAQDDKKRVSFAIPSTADGRPLLPGLGEMIEHKGQVWVVRVIVWDYDLGRVDILLNALGEN